MGRTMYLFSLTACMPASWQMALISAPVTTQGWRNSLVSAAKQSPDPENPRQEGWVSEKAHPGFLLTT